MKPALQKAAGVAEVASVGGLEKQYQVRLIPPLMSERGIALRTGIKHSRAFGSGRPHH